MNERLCLRHIVVFAVFDSWMLCRRSSCAKYMKSWGTSMWIYKREGGYAESTRKRPYECKESQKYGIFAA